MAASQEEKNILLELIDVYRSLPALWKIKSKEFSDREKKDTEYETLLNKYCEYYKEDRKEELKKKTGVLRTNCPKEVKKVYLTTGFVYW